MRGIPGDGAMVLFVPASTTSGAIAATVADRMVKAFIVLQIMIELCRGGDGYAIGGEVILQINNAMKAELWL